MKSLNYVIVEVDRAYNNEKQVDDNTTLIINSTIESVEDINRIAKVIASPSFTVLKEGDEVIIHHNICRLRNGIKGELIESNFYIEDNKYFVPLTEVFMYRRDDSDWIPLAPYCFVKPIKEEIKQIGSIIIADTDKTDTYKGMIPHEGIMVYTNPELIEYGVEKGDRVRFADYSEYEFIIDGELYYKMSTNDILGKIE